MSAQIFIDKLEASNLLDGEIIGKLRKKISKPGKTPPAQAVAKYCLEKGFLTQAQADKLLQSVSQEIAQQRAAAAQPLDVIEEANVISAADLVVEEAAVAQPVDEIVELTAAAPVVEPVAEPVTDLADPFAVPNDPLAAAPLGSDPYNGDKPDGDGPDGSNGEGEKKREFKGKKLQEQSFEGRWIVIGSGSLVILILLGWFFATVIMKGSSDEVFNEADEYYKSESYPAAVEAYKKFIKNFQGDPKVYEAHVKYRVAEMKIAAAGKDVKNTVEVFTNNIDKITKVLADHFTKDVAFKDEIRKTIALDTVKAAQKAAQKAANQATVEEKEKSLQEAREMMRLVNDGKFVPRSERELPSFSSMIEATEATLNNVENSIVQEKDTVAAVAKVKELVENDQTYDAFQEYDRLVTKHPAAEADKRVIETIGLIAGKEQSLVRKLDALAENFQPVKEPVNPAIVSRIALPTRTGTDFPDLDGQVAAFLVDGSVYGVDVGKGKIIWRHFVGYETGIDPVWLEDPRRVLISDQKNHRIRLVEPETGKTVWHRTIGEPFLRPTVSRNKIFISTESGKVARVDSETGDVSAIVQLPQKLTVPATANASGNVLYQVGEHLNVYVLSVSLTDINCIQAFYSGHRDGSVRVPPVMLQGVLLMPVNVDANKCEIRLMTNVKDKLELKRAGESHEIKSIVVKEPKIFGNYAAIVTIRGDVEVLEVASDDEEYRLEYVAKKPLNLSTGQEIYFAAANGKIWIGTKGLVQYAVVVAKQKIQDQNVADNADRFVGEFAVFDELLVHQRKRFGSRMTSIAGVNPLSLKEIWRIDIGGPTAGAPLVENDKVMGVNSQGDFFPLDDKAIADRFPHTPVYRASRTQQNLVFTRSVAFPDGSGYIIGPEDRKESISYVPSSSTLPVSLSELDIDNLKVTCDPIRFQNGVLIGLSNGEVRLVVPRSTEEDAIFVPQAKVGEDFSWQRPCQISPESFAIASSKGRLFTIKFVPNNGSPYLGQVLESNAGRRIIGPLVFNGKLIFTMGEGPNGNDVLAIDPNNLKVKGNYALGGIATWGPESFGGFALATREDGTLLAFSGNVDAPAWQTKLPHGRATGKPLSWNGKIILTLKDGKIAVIEPDGSDLKIIDTYEPLSGNSSIAGDRLFAGAADGSICVVDLTRMP